MGERLLNRFFNEALTADQKANQEAKGKQKKQKDGDEQLRDDANPMQASDAIKRILLAKKDKDWFRCN
jgi:hypothetical protein